MRERRNRTCEIGEGCVSTICLDGSSIYEIIGRGYSLCPEVTGYVVVERHAPRFLEKASVLALRHAVLVQSVGLRKLVNNGCVHAEQ